jgi:hypothetical protein
MDYAKLSNERIDSSKMGLTPFDRISPAVKDLLRSEKYVIDVHTHFFDIQCINKAYFLLRSFKNFIGLKNVTPKEDINSTEDIYKTIDQYNEDWEDDYYDELSKISNAEKGIIDNLKFIKFLKFKKMETVYNDYISNYSLANTFNLSSEKVLTTALMMDLELGWNTIIKKNIREQIFELKELANRKPVLPFLVCDPRRASKFSSSDPNNLYNLFSLAFCEGTSFFGIKIYPAMGYDPSDYRLWPIYELCTKFNIPVLTHCGGESVSTSARTLEIYEGDKKITLQTKNRKETAYILNDPARWELVLKKFPTLKLNLAHFGGGSAWTKLNDSQSRLNTITRLIETYPNVYSDLSFIFVDSDLHLKFQEMLKTNNKVKQKTLFGSDYWVVNPNINLRKEQLKFIRVLDEINTELKDVIAIENPYRYLFE